MQFSEVKQSCKNVLEYEVTDYNDYYVIYTVCMLLYRHRKYIYLNI